MLLPTLAVPGIEFKAMTSTDQQASRSEASFASKAVGWPSATGPRNPQASYYRARYYDPGPGRFSSEDPLRFRSDETNFYPYVGNDPVHKVDPGGLTKRCWGLCGGKCCNKTSHDEWWLDDGVWKRLPPGQCTGAWDDCDGMTCGGGFYVLWDLQNGTCKHPGKDCGRFAGDRWTPSHPEPYSRSPQSRGAVTNAPPPNYQWSN